MKGEGGKRDKREEGGREEDVRGGRGKKRGMKGKRTDEQVIKMKVQAEVGGGRRRGPTLR